MGTENFCLRWNDFESSVSVAFRELREDKDFFDVTLACDDEQMQAHKVILSACSPFFRNVLRKNPHEHPLLYLKGVKYTHLQAVLNFMYNGEVNVAQEELDAFMAVAEDLRVKGLAQNNSAGGGTSESRKENSYSVPKSSPATKSTPRPPPDSTLSHKRPRPAMPSISPPSFSVPSPHPNKADCRQIQLICKDDDDNIQASLPIYGKDDSNDDTVKYDSNDDIVKHGVDVGHQNIDIIEAGRIKDDMSETDEKKSNLQGSKTMMGKDMQPEVEKIAKNYDFLLNKERPDMLTFKRDNVYLAWYFTRGTVRIQGTGPGVSDESFKNCTVNRFCQILENLTHPKTVQEPHQDQEKRPKSSEESPQNVTKQTCETDLDGKTILKGKAFQTEVEKIAKTFDFKFEKAESFKLIFKREDVSVSWVFTAGIISIKGEGLNIKPFPNCTVSQFISILENPKNPTRCMKEYIAKEEKNIQNENEKSRIKKQKSCLVDELIKNIKNSKEQPESKDVVKFNNEIKMSVKSDTTMKTSNDIKAPIKHEVGNIVKVKETKAIDNDKENDGMDCDDSGNKSDCEMDCDDNDYEPKNDCSDRNDPDNDFMIEENKKARSKLKKSSEARKFDDQHISGIHNPCKPVNSKGDFRKQSYILLGKSGDHEAPSKGARAGQHLFMTKNSIPYTNTGVRNHGKTGKDHFVMAGKRMEDENVVVPEHLAGKPKIRNDGRVQFGDEIFSQRFSQGTQYMP